VSGAPEQKPAACSLSAGDHEQRRAAWKRLSERALRDQRTTPGGMELRFAADAEDELRELARLEAECCSFADWTVHTQGDEARLEVTAPAESVPAVHALFGR
jgi:hypothetical protein